MAEEFEKTKLLTLTAQIVAAHVSNNATTADALPEPKVTVVPEGKRGRKKKAA